MKVEKEILELQNEVNEITENLKDKIYAICEKLDYQNSSRFSFNIDNLEHFAKFLNEFKIIEK